MPENVLVPVDFSEVTDAVLATATRLAKALGAKAWLIHVAAPEPDFVGYEVGPQSVRDNVARELRAAHQKLEEYQEALRADGIEVNARLLPGTVPEKILQEADELAPTLIVIGSHGHGALYDLLAGSACEGVLKHATCPVVVVPGRGPKNAR
jgi:nucleotide-binding universal stress UspA family protein